MHHRIARVLTGAVALSLVVSGIAVADSVSADADVVVAGSQGMINLGTVAAGSSHQVQIAFDLLCTGTNHSAVNTTITLTPTATAPTGGAITATPGTIGPVPPTWPAAGDPCVDDPMLRSSTPSTVTVTAPPTAGTNLVYRVTYTKSPSGGVSGSTLAQIALSVVANAAPELDLPGDSTVEGNATGGWTAAYTVAATDAEDDPEPGVNCTPAAGELLGLGTTTIACEATDTAGATTTGSFDVTVVDTTPPDLGSLPSPSASAAGPDGTAVTYETPSASDVVDPSPVVGCLPASGSTFAVGTTTVTCTATDASGNSASGTFPVVVSYVAPTPSPTPTASPTPTPSTTPTPSPEPTPSAQPTPSSAPTPSPQPTPSSAPTAAPSPTPTPEPTPSAQPTPPAGQAPPAPGMAVRWDRPLGDGWAVARLGRTLPAKAEVRVGGARLVPAAGRPGPTLRADRVSACRRGAAVTGSVELGALRWHGGRWQQLVRTASLGGGCWRLVVVVNGADAGTAGVRFVDERRHGHRGRGESFAH